MSYPSPYQPSQSPQQYPPTPYSPQYPATPPPRSDAGLVGGILLICASLGLLFFCLVLAPLAAIPGIVAIAKNRSDPRGATRWMIGGWITLTVLVVLNVVLWFTMIAGITGGTLWWTNEMLDQVTSTSTWT